MNLYSSSLLFKSTLVLVLCETVRGREVPAAPVGGLDFSLATGSLIFPALELSNYCTLILFNAHHWIIA